MQNASLGFALRTYRHEKFDHAQPKPDSIAEIIIKKFD